MLRVSPSQAGVAPSGPISARARPQLPQLGRTTSALVALVGVWALAALVTVLHLDWLLLIAMLVATAGVLRAGDALLDRLMFAVTLLLGALLALGLVYSVWPWHLDPVGIAGSYLSLIVVGGALSGRAFQIPRKVRPTDLVLLGVPMLAFAELYAPIARLSPIQRFKFNSPIEDEFSHFAYYDAIHSVGGYGFLNSSKTYPFLGHPAEKIYPQGAHFLYVLLDVFTRSTTTTGTAVGEYNRFFILTMVGFAFLALAIGWAARWIAGPLLKGWPGALACTAATCFAAFGPFGFVFRTSDVAEVVGLVFLALMFAAVMRAPRRPADQLLITAAALVGVSFAYYVFLLMAIPALAVGAVAYRRRLRRHWRFAIVLSLASAAVTAVPLVIMKTASFDVQAQVAAGGAKAMIDRPLIGAMVLLVVASQATRAGRRSPTWRMVTAAVLLAGLVVLAFIYLQGGSLNHTSYYAEKMIYALFVMCLAGMGAAALLLKQRPVPGPGPRAINRFWGSRPHRILSPVFGLAVAALAVCSVVGLGAPSVDKPFWLADWASGHVHDPDEPVIAALAQRGLLTNGNQLLVATSDDGYYDYRLSLLVGDLNHHEASINMLGAGTFASDLNSINTAANRPNGHLLATDLKVLLGSITPKSGPVYVVVADQKVAAAVMGYAEHHRDLRIHVILLPAQYSA